MLRHLIAAAVLATASTAATAASIDFTFDVVGSGVSLTADDGWGAGCVENWVATDCVSASLASGFGNPGTVTIEEGWANRYTFDFLTFEGNGWGAYENYAISATLAFSSPTGATTSSGGAGGVVGVFSGYIAAGWLHWDDTPTYLTLDDGSQIWVDFQDGIDLLAGSSITTTATVKVVSVAEQMAPVPLPAGAVLLIGGLGMLPLVRRHRK